jgi:hypothetical protein
VPKRKAKKRKVKRNLLLSFQRNFPSDQLEASE